MVKAQKPSLVTFHAATISCVSAHTHITHIHIFQHNTLLFKACWLIFRGSREKALFATSIGIFQWAGASFPYLVTVPSALSLCSSLLAGSSQVRTCISSTQSCGCGETLAVVPVERSLTSYWGSNTELRRFRAQAAAGEIILTVKFLPVFRRGPQSQDG